MGAQWSDQSTAKYGQVYLRTEKLFYDCGETVTGEIYLNIIYNYPGDELVLKITGSERVNWAENKKGLPSFMNLNRGYVNLDEYELGREHYISMLPDQVTEKYYKNSIVKFKIPLFRWLGNHVPSGQFVFPFSFVIPQNIPESF